jgi:hypothetical protein
VPVAGEVPASGQTSLSDERRRLAEGRFRHAQQSLAAGNHDYGIGVLLTCCAIDPGNVFYRQALRHAREAAGEHPAGGGWLRFGFTWLKFQASKALGNRRKVLEHGERLLLLRPRDLGIPIEMARAAEGLGLLELAVWLLERAREHHSGEAKLNRALARLFEKQRQLDKAAALWQQVSEAEPDDAQAAAKVRELAARQTLAAIKSRR